MRKRIQFRPKETRGRFGDVGEEPRGAGGGLGSGR